MAAPVTDYVPVDWVDNVTPVNAANMDHIEGGIDAVNAAHNLLDTQVTALAARVTAEEAQPDVPAVVNGQWIKGAGGALTWAAITQADVSGLVTSLGQKEATANKGIASGYAPLDATTKVAESYLPAYLGTAQLGLKEDKTQKGAANGYAPLDSNSQVPLANLYNAPTAQLWHSTVQTLPDAVATVVTWDTERFDNDNMHDGTNPTRLTCRTAGIYLITLQAQVATNAVGRRAYQLRLNGSTVFALQQFMAITDGFPTAAALTVPYALNVGDYVEGIVLQAAGGGTALNLASNTYSPIFSMTRIAESS